MDKIQIDEVKIKMYAQIQESLCNLEENSTDEDIDKIIMQIPQSYLTSKDDLMVICELFAYYSRYFPLLNTKNAFKLFNKIMTHIKTNLQDESSFFWNIFGGSLHFKYWMYEEGLISLDQVILSAHSQDSQSIIEIFLPEIIEKQPDIFHKMLKFNYTLPYSDDYINEFKERRKKHLDWLKDSCDYKDPFYEQIEINPLRLAIKRDDLISFQKVLSEKKLTINSRIFESTFEKKTITSNSQSLINLSIRCNSIQIFNYLMSENASLDEWSIFYSIFSRNSEIIEKVRLKLNGKMDDESILLSALFMWNDGLDGFIQKKSEYNFLFQGEVTSKQYAKSLTFFGETFKKSNFVFFQKVLLPFLNRNPKFISENIYDILFASFNQKSCFFMQQFLKYGIDINYHSESEDETLISKAILEDNSKAVQILFKFPDIKINSPAFMTYPAFFLACKNFSDMKIIDLFCNYPSFDINYKESLNNVTAFVLSVTCGNAYVVEYLLKKFPDLEINSLQNLIFSSIESKYLYVVKILIKAFYSDEKKIIKLIRSLKKYLFIFDGYHEDYLDEIRQIALELGINCPEISEIDMNYKEIDSDEENKYDYGYEEEDEEEEEEEEEEGEEERNENDFKSQISNYFEKFNKLLF